MKEKTRRERIVVVERLVFDRYHRLRVQCREDQRSAFPDNVALNESRSLHYKIFYSNYKPNMEEELIQVLHPLLVA